MTPATEKAAPIPADVLALAERFATMQYGGREPNTKGWQERRDWFARAIMQDRADRASQEERIREDERAPETVEAEDAIRALIPEAPVRDDWQPIETAPKDGVVVWVWCPAYEDLGSLTSLASWHEDAGWCVDELRTPTMWCPLQVPAPPSQDREPDSQRGVK